MHFTGLGQLNNCNDMLFPKVNKISLHFSIFILQCNTIMSKNFVAHSITVACVIG